MWKNRILVLVFLLLGLFLFMVMLVLVVLKGNLLLFDCIFIVVYRGVFGYVFEYMIFFYEIV